MGEIKTGAEIVWECLIREGVEVVFGYPGGANLPIYDALTKYQDRIHPNPYRQLPILHSGAVPMDKAHPLDPRQ